MVKMMDSKKVEDKNKFCNILRSSQSRLSLKYFGRHCDKSVQRSERIVLKTSPGNCFSKRSLKVTSADELRLFPVASNDRESGKNTGIASHENTETMFLKSSM